MAKSIHPEDNKEYMSWEILRKAGLVLLHSLGFALLATIPVMLSADLDAPVHYGTSIAALSISNILSFLPFTVAGFGTREFVFTRVWTVQSSSAVIAVSVSFAYFLTTHLGSIFSGGMAYPGWIRRFYPVGELRRRTNG